MQEQWKLSIDEELENFKRNETWDKEKKSGEMQVGLMIDVGMQKDTKHD